jgi:hypothetical protein
MKELLSKDFLLVEYIQKEKPIHQIASENHVRDDNRIENLQLMTFKEHSSLHMKERWEKKKGVKTYQ